MYGPTAVRQQTLSTQPHLPSLSVKNFRGIVDLSIPRLGHVTMIAGKNGVGKTSLLEAVRLYAARGNSAVISGILWDREEFTTVENSDGDESSVPDFEALFHDRHPTEGSCISIGPADAGQQLNIRYSVEPLQQAFPLNKGTDPLIEPSLAVEFAGVTQDLSMGHLLRTSDSRRSSGRTRRSMPDSRFSSAMRCESIGPEVMNNDSIARFWDRVALTDYEMRAVDALKFIYDDNVDRVAMLGDEAAGKGRLAVVRIRGQERPVPLRSLGDGAVRMFGTALSIAGSSDGFLVIDEAENGIHHSVQTDFWKMVMRSALDNNVQVVATTHSWDCVVGFSRAAMAIQDTEARLVRIDRIGDQLRVVEYTEEDLQVVTRQRIEVR